MPGRDTFNPFGPFGSQGPGSMGAYFVDPALAGGRLTLMGATPVTVTDVVGGDTVFYTPYKHNRISLWSSGEWKEYGFREISFPAVLLSAGKVYDFFITSESSSSNRSTGGSSGGGGSPVALLPGPAWTTDIARAEVLGTVDGIYCKLGRPNWKYVGTARTNATPLFVDSASIRGVWNMYNRVLRSMSVTEATGEWTYSTATYRQANASVANQLAFVRGLNEDAVTARVQGKSWSGSNNYGAVGIGLDATTVNSGHTYGAYTTGIPTHQFCQYNGYPGTGYHFLAWLEISGSGISTTFQSVTGAVPEIGRAHV